MENKIEKSKDKKIYVLLFFLLVVFLLGIWKCPSHFKDTSVDEIQKENDSIQIVASRKKEAVLLDTTTSSVIEKVNADISTPVVKEDIAKTTPSTKEAPPITKQEEDKILVKEKVTPNKADNKEVPVQEEKTAPSPSPSVVLKKSCTSNSTLKIDKSGYQLCLAISPNGASFAAGNNNGVATIYNMDGKEIIKLAGHKKHIGTIAFSPDGKYILTGGVDNLAILWNANSGEMIRKFEGHTKSVANVAFAPNGKYILTGSEDHKTILWDINTGKQELHLRGHKSEITALAFSPNGKRVLTGNAFDSGIKLWDIQSGEVLLILEGQKGFVSSVVFTPDERFILAGTSKGNAILWNAKSGKQIRIMKCHKEEVRSIDISSDGQFFITASGDDSIKYWQLLNGRELCKLSGHSNEVTEAKFHPINNKRIVSTSIDRTIRMWEVDFEN